MIDTAELPVEEYCRRRREYYGRFPAFWATFPAGTEAEEEYAVYGAVGVSTDAATGLRTASQRLLQVLTKVATWVQVCPDEVLHDIGVPEEAREYARISIPGMCYTVVGRFEFAMTEHGPKLLELNAETPTLIVELFRMNGQVCRDFGLHDPNAAAEGELRNALVDAIEAGLKLRVDDEAGRNVVFTSYGDHQEDRETVQYLLNLLPASQRYTASYCALDGLSLTSDELRDHHGRPIDVLYKLYPTEHLIGDYAPDRVPIGRMVMGLVRTGRLAVINPPVSFLLQTKGLLALTWGLHEAGAPFLSSEEHQWIHQYMLPTYLEPTDEQGVPIFSGSYIAKPVYGREGGSIVVHRKGKLLEVNPNHAYSDQRYIYQEHVALPTTVLLTEKGRREVNMVFNCFVVGGRPSAVGIRAGPRLILDDNAYFVPMCYRRDRSDTSVAT